MILMNDFASEPEELRRLELASCDRVFRSGRFILGSEVEQFERDWAKFCGARFAVGSGNGMDALELGLRALDIGPAHEVITTPTTAIATVMAIVRAGATPVLADIDPQTALLDLASVERCLSPRTKAVLVVHLYGHVREMERWAAFCKNAKIHLLEDCAQAHGAAWNGQRAGVFGAWGAFSFYPTKNLGAKGDGGALVTNSEEIANRVRTLRNYGEGKRRYEHLEAGLNSRLDELQAAILSVRLPWLEGFNARRKEIAAKYFGAIKNSRIQLLSAPSSAENHVYHFFVIRCADRDRLAQVLNEHGIQSLIHYPIPAHRQGCCRNTRCDPHGLPNAESHAEHCLSLPCHPQLRDKDVAKIIATISQFE
jgi:dTDP-4-amino-4,6-dideoxygalactose transaminase